MKKSYRQGQILELIRTRKIATQEELARALRDAGIATTQVTLSRDIRELGLVKTPQGYRRMDPERGGPEFATVVAEFLLEVRVAQNLVVLKTSPAHAAPLARALDQQEWADVVGTVAGDDTVLVVTPDRAAAEAVRAKLVGVAG